MSVVQQNARVENGVGDMNMCSEFERLASFDSWPHWATQNAWNLAENGFYYTGTWDKVVCFSCRGEIDNWRASDSVPERHRNAFPECNFVKGRDRSNVAMGTAVGGWKDGILGDTPDVGSKKQLKEVQNSKSQTSKNNKTTDKNKTKTDVSSSSSSNSAPSRGSIHDAEELLGELRSLSTPSTPARRPATSSSVNQVSLVSNSAAPTTSGEPPAPTDPGDQTPDTPNGDVPMRLEGTTAANRGSVSDWYEQQITGDPDSNQLLHEAYRLRTFVGKWSGDYFVSPVDLAKSGFYYHSAPDKVQCAFCRGRLLNWSPTDVPMNEHRKHFPTCPFVKGRNVGNIPMDESNERVQLPAKKRDNPTPDRLGIVTGRAKHSRYSMESARLESYKTWPKNHVLTPAILAKAGFFYVGYSDNVKCFYCDGGLRNWEAGDEPWREHARWFSRCGFLLLCKGAEYIEQVLAETSAQGNGLNRAGAAGAGAAVARPGNDLDLTKSLDTPMVRAVINMGYSKELVRKVTEKQRKDNGKDFQGAEELFEAVLVAQYEEEPQQDETQREVVDHLEQPQKVNQSVTGKEERPSEQTGRGSEESIPPPTTSESGTKKKKNKKKKKSKTPNEPAPAEKTAPERSNSFENSPAVDEDEGVKELMKEYQRVREERTCKICMDEDCTVVFLPCGHLVCCPSCAPAIRTCPICRTLIKGSVRVLETESKDLANFPSLTT